MAHKKAGGATSNGRDSNPKMLGVKIHDGQPAKIGSILIRQRGTQWFPGKNVGTGKDFTLFSMVDGMVKYTQKRQLKFNGQTHYDTLVHVMPSEKLEAGSLKRE